MNWYTYPAQTSIVHPGYHPYHNNNNNTMMDASMSYYLNASSMMAPDTMDAYDEQQNPAGKRQRRQAAATLVSNVSNWTGVGGKKSKAQPRPQIQIPPKGIGPIQDPNQNDVLVSLVVGIKQSKASRQAGIPFFSQVLTPILLTTCHLFFPYSVDEEVELILTKAMFNFEK
jgi:hypothetical protein